MSMNGFVLTMPSISLFLLVKMQCTVLLGGCGCVAPGAAGFGRRKGEAAGFPRGPSTGARELAVRSAAVSGAAGKERKEDE